MRAIQSRTLLRHTAIMAARMTRHWHITLKAGDIILAVVAW